MSAASTIHAGPSPDLARPPAALYGRISVEDVFGAMHEYARAHRRKLTGVATGVVEGTVDLSARSSTDDPVD